MCHANLDPKLLRREAEGRVKGLSFRGVGAKEPDKAGWFGDWLARLIERVRRKEPRHG